MTRVDAEPMIAQSQRGGRTAVSAGIVAGLAIVLSGSAWVMWRRMSTSPPPDIATAAAREVVAYLEDERGFRRLPKVEQDRYFAQLKEHFRQDGPQRELKKLLDALPEPRLEALREALEAGAWRLVIGKARQYHATPPEQRFAFLERFHSEAEADLAWLKGNGDAEKDLTSRLGTGLPSTPEQLYKYINTRTTPEERQLLEAFVNDVQEFDELNRRRAGRPSTGG